MILKKNHKIPLDKFVDFCLYDKKKGYYMNKDPFGINGDFTTAPNISRLFSEMIAIWTISFWENLGHPKKFYLIELGAGNGEMMKVMIESFKKFPYFLNCCEIIIYEKSPYLIKKQKKNIKFKNIKWIKNLSKLKKRPSIFLANEFFDAMPIKQFFKDRDDWYERYVKISENEKLNFVKQKSNIKYLEKKLGLKISNKQKFIEYSPLGIKYFKDIFKIIKQNKGGLLIIDYGYFTKEMRNTLKAIHKQSYSNIFENIGHSDITYNINFYLISKIAENFQKFDISYTSQRNFLLNLGILKRAEIIGKNKSFKDKSDIFYRLRRLINENEMGKIFKVMLIKKSANKFHVGFED